MLLIHDCSNSDERPQNRGFGGSVENACVALLKKHAHRFNCEFTTRDKAQVFFTNDVFPQSVVLSGKPLVKRMDGIFWQRGLQSRNICYNESAQLAHYVVFVSKYSQSNYYQFGSTCKDCVALNWVDTDIFYPHVEIEIPKFPHKWLAVATSWSRAEKRPNEINSFAKMLPQGSTLTLVGNDGFSGPNILKVGYLQPEELANLMRHCDALVNFSYRDASPKVVAEAISCGIPVLYANSGGTPELALYGVGVPDPQQSSIEDKIPELLNIKSGLIEFYDMYATLRLEAFKSVMPDLMQNNMLTRYFNAFRSFNF